MIERDKPVRVFKNLKHGCYSILQNGRVRASAKQVRLGDVEFRVREAGRQKMIREQRRNVHAFAVGKLLDFVHPDEPRTLASIAGRNAIYDPYRFASFVDRDTADPVIQSTLAQLDELGVTYTPTA